MLLGHAHQNPRTPQMGGGRCRGQFPRPAPGAAEEYPGSRRDVLNAERDGGCGGAAPTPPFFFLYVGALPPHPRFSIFMWGRCPHTPGFLSLCGGSAPTPPFFCLYVGALPPHPHFPFFMWGRCPHTPVFLSFCGGAAPYLSLQCRLCSKTCSMPCTILALVLILGTVPNAYSARHGPSMFIALTGTCTTHFSVDHISV